MRNNEDIDHIFFSSDWHLLHPKIVQICPRPIDAIQHDDWVISRINEKIGRNDVLYLLGDVTMKSSADVIPFLKKVICQHIHFVQGNHDPDSFMHNPDNFFDSVSQIKTINFNSEENPNVHIVGCHYPILRWDRKDKGSIHLHGHDHNEYEDEGLSIDVGLDAQNYYPISLRQVLERVELIKSKG